MGLDVFTNNSLLVSKATFFLARIIPCSNLFILFFFSFLHVFVSVPHDGDRLGKGVLN